MTSKVKKKILKLKESSTLVINEKSKALISKGKKVYQFGFGQSPFPVPEKIVDALKATLPAGTLSGAPKIRAMEIINELEPSSRGIYGGAIGYISWNGNIDTAIAIRTAVIKNNLIHVGAGAGIVADSDHESEWQECIQKSKVFLDAMEMIK